MIEKLEALIRSGDLKQVEQILKHMSLRKIPRAQAVTIANFARRVNQCPIALRILSPIIHRDPHSLEEPATELERIEYAESLRKVGAVQEASEILQAIDPKEHPRSLLHLALCCFSQWKYQEALPFLREYVQAERLSDYDRLVGKVNLVAALIYVDLLVEADRLLEEIRAESRRDGRLLLFGNSLELSAQLEIKRCDFARARSYLAKAGDSLQSASAVMKLWIDKWDAIADSLSKQTVSHELLRVRELAVAHGHWETVRDCESYRAQISRDRAAMEYVYFGTPYESYRKNIMKYNREWYEPSAEILLLPESGFKGRALDLASATLEGSGDVLGFGHLQHRFMILLARDFFKPLPVLAAFGQLFPGEHFNVISAPGRIYQTVKRLRRALAEIKDGPCVIEADGNYRLALRGSVALRIEREPILLEGPALTLHVLARRFGADAFSVSEAREVMGGSVSTLQRALREAVSRNELKKSGVGPSTRYQVRKAS